MKNFHLFRFIANSLKNWICTGLGICLVATFNVTSAQTVYQAGKYSLLLENGMYYDISGPDTTKVTTNHMAIKLREGISENERSEFLSRHPLSYSGMGTTTSVIIFNIDSLANFVNLIENIANDPDVELYDINHLVPICDTGKPNDGHDQVDYLLLNSYPNLLWPYINTNLFEAWNFENGDSSIIVAEIDNGIWIDHPDISYGFDNYSNLWNNHDEINGISNYDDDGNGFEDDFHGWNFTEGNGDLMHDNIFADKGTHGTIMSGIIAAKTNNELGIWGTAGGYSTPGIRILPVKCNNLEDPNLLETDYIIAGIDYAIALGARVINMPFAGADFPGIHNKISEYFNQGNVVFLAATGNDWQDDIDGEVYYPAKYEEVIGVGATECNPQDLNSLETRWILGHSWSSQYGVGIDICAPGSPFTTDFIWDGNQYSPTYNYYTIEDNGSTSRAVSFASGVVALILSANPCLTNEEVMDTLRNTAYKFPYPGLEWEYGWNKYYGYGRIDALKALQPVIIPPIEENTTWNSDMKIYNEINIENGAELTIQNCTISMSSWAKIIVKPGGTLILNNCTLTGICNSIMWPGIEVWGYPNAPQFKYPLVPYPQGVIILNGATIENAVTAINLWKPDDYTMTGGIVEAYNSTFKNNVMSVHALYYRNFNPLYPTQELDYYGIFTNCSFIIDAQYLGDKKFYKHVDLCHVRGLQFNGCTFSLDHDASNISEWSDGIAAYNAGFYVRPYCPSHTIPCVDADSCRFSGFYRGIGSITSDLIPHPTFIHSARFDDNAIGVYLSSTNYAVVLGNYFEVGYDEGTTGHCGFANGFGIDVNLANGFCIENNKLRKNFSAPTGIYAGIRVQNCPSEHDIIYKNELIGLSYGNYAEGTNRSEDNDANTGVEYQCNYNANNLVDFIVTADEYIDAMIHGWQGSKDTAAGNIFSDANSTDYHFSNKGYNMINYYYCDPYICNNEEPTEIFAWIEELFEKKVSNENNCADHYGGIGHISLTYGERLEKEESFAQNLNDYNAVSYIYESLIDGGNTEIELSEIESAEPDDIWALRTQLLGHSPHLSQEVLRAMAERTDVFPDEVLLEILSSNPDELNKDTLISFLEQKEDPLPDYMIDILRQAIGGITYKTILEDEMAQYHAAKTQAAQDIIRSILFDTVFIMTDYRNWLDNMDNMIADRQIIASYLSENDTTNAIALLNLLPSLYNLEGESLSDYNTYKALVELQIQWLAESETISELDSIDIILLGSLAEDSTSIAGNMARNILSYAYDQHYCNCLQIPDSSYLKNKYVPTVTPRLESELINISAKPNPARAYVAFDYELVNRNSSGLIFISDVNGRTISQIQVNGKVGQKVWNTTGLKAGEYFYTLTSDGLRKSGKVVIY
jgi:hypothetical protein